MQLLKLALRNLSRSKRRNVILGVAVAFGFFVVTAVDGLTSGAVSNIEEQITQMIGGTVIVAGYEKYNKTEESAGSLISSDVVPIIRDHDYLIKKVDDLGIKYKYISHYTNSTGQIIFNGKKVLTQTYGRDFETDKSFLDSLQIVEGDFENLKTPGSIIIGKNMADSLKVHVGDTVLYLTSTIYGQNEVGEFTVGLINKDSSFISGMMCYADIESINKLIGIPEGGYNYFSIYLKDKNQQNKVALILEDSIRADGKNVSDLRLARKTNPDNVEKGLNKQMLGEENAWEGIKYFVESLNDGAPALKTAMNVVHLVTTIILIVILLIVMVGVSNTYRMVLYERIREIGTMRALGMTGKDTGKTFTLEAIALCIIGAAAGFVLAIILMLILGIPKFSTESVQFLLHNGHMSFTLSFGSIVVQYLCMILLTSLAVRGTSKKAAKMSPAEALRTIK
ncbi:MAG: ABC transporter permease [Treponema sp.]|nr:ABC transporter permease [Treponema sp.]